MATTKKIRYTIDEDQHTATWETGAEVDYEEAPPAEVDEVTDVDYELAADPEYDESVQADFDELADPDYGDEGVEAEAAREAEDLSLLPATTPQVAEGFSYELGRAVLPVTQAQPHPVVWRGYLKERHPATGLVHRVPVYLLDDGFWDCYREDELQLA